MVVTLGPKRKIKRLGAGSVSKDGARANFRIVTEDGLEHSFWCDADELSRIGFFALELSQFAAHQGGGLQAPKRQEKVLATPISAVEIGMAPGRSQDEVMLAVHIGTAMPLVFALPPHKLADLRKLIDQQLVTGEKRAKN
jgi:hypothetical protein